MGEKTFTVYRLPFPESALSQVAGHRSQDKSPVSDPRPETCGLRPLSAVNGQPSTVNAPEALR